MSQHDNEPEAPLEGISRRSFLGAGSAALAMLLLFLAAGGTVLGTTLGAVLFLYLSMPKVLESSDDTGGA